MYINHQFHLLANDFQGHGEEVNEAHSLIANVAGRVLMLQKDKPAAKRESKTVTIFKTIIFKDVV